MSERDIFHDDTDKPFHRPECQCDWCEEWRDWKDKEESR